MSIDRNSADWKEIAGWAELKLTEMRKENDADLDTEETNKLRGRIEFAKELLALGDEPEKKVETEGGDPYNL